MNKSPMQLQIFDKWQKLLFSDYKEIGHVSDFTAKKAYKVLRDDEQFFGLGEKAASQSTRTGIQDVEQRPPLLQCKRGPLYKSIPFFMSSYQYGIFLDNTYKTEFKFGTESNEYYSFEAPDGAFVYYFIFGKDYKDIQSQYISDRETYYAA